MKFLKKNLKLVIGIIIGLVLATGITAYATYKYFASDIEYTDNKNVAQALNELYGMSQLEDRIATLETGTSKVDILYDGTTDSQGIITQTSGTAAERTFYKNVSDYDFVYVYGGYKNGTTEYYYMTPAIIHKSFYNMNAACGGLVQFSSTFNQCCFNTKIDSANNKIIFISRGSDLCTIVKVVGVKY